MHIKPRSDSSARKNLVGREVRRAHSLGPLSDPVCDARCPDYNCVSACHRYCAAAPSRLSSEGDRGPVEPLVAPLVFEIKKLGVFYPCWSCEGHAGQAGETVKIPRVWFYSDSVVHVRALTDAVNRMFHAGRLSVRWHVTLTYSDPDNPDTTFSLEPEATADVSLSRLQADLRVMADELAPQFWRACDALASS